MVRVRVTSRSENHERCLHNIPDANPNPNPNPDPNPVFDSNPNSNPDSSKYSSATTLIDRCLIKDHMSIYGYNT